MVWWLCRLAKMKRLMNKAPVSRHTDGFRGHIFQHNFCIKPYVPREPRRDPSNRRLWTWDSSDTSITRTRSLFRHKCTLIPLSHRDGHIEWVKIKGPYKFAMSWWPLWNLYTSTGIVGSGLHVCCYQICRHDKGNQCWNSFYSRQLEGGQIPKKVLPLILTATGPSL